MKTWVRLLIPVALGLTAVWLNTTVMNAKLEPVTFISVSHDLSAGDVFSPSSIQPRSFSGKASELLESAVQWKDRAVILGREVPRPLRTGDLVLWRDSTPPARELTPDEGEASLPISLASIDIIPSLLLVGEEIGFYIDSSLQSGTPGALQDLDRQYEELRNPGDPVYVGPFRVLSVGQRLTRTSDNVGTDAQIVTVAIPVDDKGNSDPNTNLLLRARARRGSVLAVVLHRSKRSPDAIRNRYRSSQPGDR